MWNPSGFIKWRKWNFWQHWYEKYRKTLPPVFGIPPWLSTREDRKSETYFFGNSDGAYIAGDVVGHEAHVGDSFQRNFGPDEKHHPKD